jgi:predicted ArsR family transcriptional regulator
MDASNFTFDLDVEGFSEQINQFTQKIGDHISQFSTDLETKFGPEFTEKIARKAEQAAAKAAKAAERARQQAERRARAYGRPPTPPRPKRRKASSDEQIKILKMVEQGIITPDEAATLLEALEK